ncbi:MAG: AbgT family transporter [Phycisphaerae bacterium]|nr:AbgT family transporter [Phycisphaerae bacterium]
MPTHHPETPMPNPAAPMPRAATMLDRVERIGNSLPEPALLFALLAALVVALSAIGSAAGWKVQPVVPRVALTPQLDPSGRPVLDAAGSPRMTPKLDARGRPEVVLVGQTDTDGAPVELRPRSLLTGDGLYWMLASMVRNFTGLPALGLVFVSMLGIGLAEKFGLFSALMRGLALMTPRRLLTPMIVCIGANASVASDAGYVILPPLAAALYLAVGRSPIAGLAAAFAGVAGGFGAGVFPTAADGFLAGVATQAAHIIDPVHRPVDATHNIYFKSVSALVITLAGWFVTDRIVEPRLQRQTPVHAGDTSVIADLALKPIEKRGLLAAGAVAAVVLAAFACAMLIPSAPLHGTGQPTLASGAPAPGERAGERWSQVIVPMIFLTFLLPGMAFGLVTGVLRRQADFIEAIYHGIRTIVPVLAIAFFMGQFVNYFQYTGLDRMLAYAGGSLLVRADLPVPLLILLFVLLVVLGDFAMSGMLSKFGVLAPIFIPMFMMVGMSPELTTAAYRIGDSVVNIITPLNSYLLIILVALQKYKPGAGLGSLISLMLPYSLVFGLVWTGFLLAWYASGLPLGTDAPLHYVPGT